MRLIDADSFKSFLQALVKAGAPYDDVITLLDKEKTAYYPEKTIAEIKKKSRKMSTIKMLPLGILKPSNGGKTFI